MTQQALDSKLCSFLRLPMVFMVILIHCSSMAGTSHAYTPPCEWDWSNLSWMNFCDSLRVLGSHVISHVAVPIFFLISGYYFFFGLKEWNRSVYQDKLRKRFTTLAIPYIVWITIAISVSLMLGGISFAKITKEFPHLYWDYNVWDLNNTNWLGLPTISSSPYLVPMWFVRDLIVVVLCSPLVYYGVKHLKQWMIALLVLIYVSKVWIPLPGFSPAALLFFGFGSYLSINKIHISTFVQSSACKKIAIFSLLLLPFMFWYDGHNTKMGELIYPFYIISSVCLTLRIGMWIIKKIDIKDSSFIMRYSGSSFFIFAVHGVFAIVICQKLYSFILPIGDGYTSIIATLRYVLSPFIVLAICLIMFQIVRKLPPPFTEC